MVPDCNNRCNNNGMDSALLLSALNNGGGFGGNGNWMWIIFLFFLEPLMRGGFFGNGMFGNGGANGLGYTDNLINNAAGRELLMQGINGNGNAIQQLATTLNCDVNAVQQAICGLDKAIAQLGGQVGMSGQQTINALQLGNQQLQAQLASCCCDIREAVTAGNYQNQIATLQQTNTLEGATRNVGERVTQGFCDTAYAFRDQTCQLGSAIKDSTQAIKDVTNSQTQAVIAKLDDMQRTSLLDKIDALREQNSQLRTQRDIVDQNIATQQMIGAAIAPISAALAKIQCAQPNTVTVPYYPFQVTPWNGNNGCGCGCGNNNYAGQFYN